MNLSDNKKLFIGVVIFIGFLIIMHGNEIGEFRNTHKANAKLDPILYVVCSIPLFVFLRKRLQELRGKDRILTIILIMILALLPMFFLSGVCKWVDYLTSNKQWKVEKATIVNKIRSTHGRGADTYLYDVKIRDTTIKLSTTLNLPIEKVLYLKICKTNLGMIIADEYYP
jgi:hypothetical protein